MDRVRWVLFTRAHRWTRRMQMNVGQECSRPAVTVAMRATLAEAAVLMRERNVGAVIVTRHRAIGPPPSA